MTRYQTPTGKVLEEYELSEYLETVYTADDHENFLNDIEEEVFLFGTWRASPGRIVRELDPIFFDLSYQEEINNIISERLEDFGITEIEDGDDVE